MQQPEPTRVKILRFVYQATKEKSYPPSVREIAAAVGLNSTSTVQGHLDRLEKNGFIARDRDKKRAIELTKAGLESLGVFDLSMTMPVFELATMGFDDNSVPQFPLPPNLMQFRNHLFMMRFHGDTLLKLGIIDGDNLIVRRQSEVDNGEIVVVKTLKGEYLSGRLFHQDTWIRLQPENDALEAIVMEAERITILGRVVGLYRDSIY
ncbi:MAG: transcriptional repressor LexA [Lactobacillaceae bacterium]|jgi:repressor LexA|nr:transcriptional repressor LexA [Lactobacillaceae bacterium]